MKDEECPGLWQLFSQDLTPQDHVLEFGPGGGEQLAYMAQHYGAKVVGVDRRRQPDNLVNIKGLTWVKKDVRFWLPECDENFTQFWARFVIAFLEKSWLTESLFPWLRQHILPGGKVGIATFYKEPAPAFEECPKLPSLWTVDELVARFPGWDVLYNEQGDHLLPDLNGRQRRFFNTEVLVQRP